jgi:hypothetical protein
MPTARNPVGRPTARLAVGNLDECAPAGELKIGAAQIEGEAELAPLGAEVFFQFAHVGFESTCRLFEAHGFAVPAPAVGVPGLRMEIARVGANRLLPGQARVELQRDQTLLGRSQKQETYGRANRRGMKYFHKDPAGRSAGGRYGGAFTTIARPFPNISLIDRIVFLPQSVCCIRLEAFCLGSPCLGKARR